MRTTVRLDEDLLKAAKQHAAGTGRTLTSVLEDALRAELSRAQEAPTAPPFHVRPIDSGFHPGISLDDNARLLQVMDDA